MLVRASGKQLGRAAASLARRLVTLTPDDSERDDPRLADPRLTVDFFTRHFLHDIAHYLAEAMRDDRADGARPEDGDTTHQRIRGFPWLN